MTPPRRKLHEVKYDEEVSKRMRLLSREELYVDGLNIDLDRIINSAGLPLNDSLLPVINPSINSAFQPYIQAVPPNALSRTTTQQVYYYNPDMYFFKNNENGADFSTKRCRSFFKNYVSHNDPEAIGPDGIERLCNDLQVKPEDSVVLVLSWKLNAKVMGIYTADEWLNGMSELKCDSITKLRNKIGYLRSCLSDPLTFKSIYRYSFDFAKDENQRCLDVEVAKQMLGVLLASRWRVFGLFAEFLSTSNYRVINKDQYFNILDFSRSVDDDLKNYDENSAWPVLLDEFVEYCRKYKGFLTPIDSSSKIEE